jgi:sulfite dehydrogenase (cytochrome) subunit B
MRPGNVRRGSTIALLIATLACGVDGKVGAAEKTIVLPADGVQLQASALPGFAKAQADCAACHSAEYMLYQPATAPRAYWEAMVLRMKTVFKAPIDDTDVPLLVDYLVKTYGNEQAK